MIIIASILFCIVLSAKLQHDLKLWHDKEIKGISTKTVNHTKEAILVIAALVPSGIIFFLETAASWKIAAPVVLCMQFFTFWLLFDGIYNVWRNRPWFDNGSNDEDDAGTDNFLQGLPTWLQAVIKIGGAAASVIIYKQTFL